MDSKHSDDDYIINDTEYEEDEADIAFDKQEKSKKKGIDIFYDTGITTAT